MKLYMIRKETFDGKFEYRTSGMYDRWTSQGKCWNGKAFKSFLIYDRDYNGGNKMLDKLLSYPTATVLIVDTDNEVFCTRPLKLWVEENL